MDNAPFAGAGAFSSGMTNTGPAPTAAGMLPTARAGQFRFRIAQNGINLGFLGLTGSQSMWWSIVDKEADAVAWEWYPVEKLMYLKNPAWVNGWGTWSTSLSGSPCACNDWGHAGSFALVGSHLVAGDGATVGRYSGDRPWLYANSDYAALDFSYV